MTISSFIGKKFDKQQTKKILFHNQRTPFIPRPKESSFFDWMSTLFVILAECVKLFFYL